MTHLHIHRAFRPLLVLRPTSLLSTPLSCTPARHTSLPARPRLRMTTAVYSTASLKESNATPFSAMAGKLDASLLKSLAFAGYQFMTPVQHKVLTDLPNFRSDCLVQAKTGTGKTVAFLLPALHSILNSSTPIGNDVAMLIMSPTRELALQIAKECDQLTSRLPKPLECHTAFGGTARDKNLKIFISGRPTILVATPGRLKDYLSEPGPRAKLARIRTLVLDEADTMLEQGFLEEITTILKLLPPKASGWQGMCFSATIPPKIKTVLSHVLSPGYKSISTIADNEVPTVERVPQYHVIIPSVKDTFTTLLSVLEQERASAEKIIVFGVTAKMVALFAEAFEGLTPLKVYQLHSRLSQAARTRTTNEFKAASSGVMFASDVIGRGMDFPNVDLIIQVGLPPSGEQYVHRVGRTARAGNDGKAVIILTEAESFFIGRNPKLPIKPHPMSAVIVQNAITYAPKMEVAMNRVSEETKQKAYQSYLGFFAGSGFLKSLRLDKAGLVQLCNNFALSGMHCPEVPGIQKSTVGKMGLKGVPGLRYATFVEPPRKNGKRQLEQDEPVPVPAGMPPRRSEANLPKDGRRRRGGGHTSRFTSQQM